MASNNILSHQFPPNFNGENYAIWSVKMEAYLRGYDLWDVIESGGEVLVLRKNATLAQIKQHNEEVIKRYRVLTCMHGAISDAVFTRIMGAKSAKEAWDKLKEEFQGSERTKQMQVMNLLREFETLRMRDTENVKDYINKIMRVVNQVRLLGENLSESRVVQKVLVSLSKKIESTITSLEGSKDLSTLTLIDVVNALQAAEQMRAM
ncbi:PREDICTED: uncharacterized protein LOC108662012 [Theobroma cacao]|uniref:Uncharacterized protein LOC108662012 n=1 Tax=Theobroma cacao TaxID=3641 RepID=A0AB32WAM8_THECC|nr:PREDICTED: uncharacterized protein LOC108662012 [Theobroma cacao]